MNNGTFLWKLLNRNHSLFFPLCLSCSFFFILYAWHLFDAAYYITSHLFALYIEEGVSNCLLRKDRTLSLCFASLINCIAFQCKCKFPRFQWMTNQFESTGTIQFEWHCTVRCCYAALRCAASSGPGIRWVIPLSFSSSWSLRRWLM